MKTSSLLLSTLFALVIAGLPAPVRADCVANLHPSIASPLRLIRRPFDHRPRGQFAVRVDNSEACDVSGRAGIKPLIIPAADTIPHGSHTHPSGDGHVFPTTFVDLDIRGAQSRTYLVQGRLPPLEWQTWRLTAIVDSGHTIPETDELDNVPDLISAGYFGVERGNPPEIGLDLTTTIPSELTKQMGGVAHSLGLHSRPIPSPPLDSHDVGVRFLLASVETGKVYTLIYAAAKPCRPDCDPGLTCNMATSQCVDANGNSVPEIDKEYYAIGWGPGFDELGRPNFTDIYWQAPRFVDTNNRPFVPPGRYRFLSIIDSWDRVPEHDEGNNIDAVPFTLAPLELVGFPNTWFVTTATASAPSVTVTVLNSYSADLEFTVEVPPTAAAWLSVTTAGGGQTGHLGIDQSAELTFSVARGSLPAGEYEEDVTITATGLELFPVVVPVKFYIYDTDVPGMTIAPVTLDFATSIGVHPPAQQVTVSNPGTLELEWESYPNVDWISVAPPFSDDPPGGSEQVSLIVHPEGMAPGGPYIGTVSMFNDAPNGALQVTARLVVAPCDSAFCNEGWLCNTATHFCEPPGNCTTHADCPVGQHCPPGGTCEQSGICSTDIDCQFVWSPFGATRCNAARGTCELASCARDQDCPVGSYCDESAGFCPYSGNCTTDADCFFGFPFRQVCDHARNSCRPSECTTDTDCPSASYCAAVWGQCVSTAHCTSNRDCYSLGLQCDIPRDACRP